MALDLLDNGKLFKQKDVRETKVSTTIENSRIRATRGTVQSIANNTWTKVQINTEVYDTLSEYDNVTDYRFKAKTDGYYLITAAVGTQAATWDADEGITISLYKNGIAYAYEKIYMNANSVANIGLTISISDVFYLKADEYIEVWVLQDQGAAVNLIGAGEYNHLTIHRLS